MNDTELDDMLNKWGAPSVPRGLRERISQGPSRNKWKFRLPSGLFFGLAAGAAMCFLGIATAFPQVLRTAPRFNLLTEYVDHEDDGTSIIREYRASTARNGQEIILDRSNPDSWLMNLHLHLFDTLHRLLGANEPAPASMASDCSISILSPIGHETLLNYKTTEQGAIDPDGTRYTEWRAPDLDCIVMKYVKEEPSGNGQFRISSEKRPLSVRINRAQ